MGHGKPGKVHHSKTQAQLMIAAWQGTIHIEALQLLTHDVEIFYADAKSMAPGAFACAVLVYKFKHACHTFPRPP